MRNNLKLSILLLCVILSLVNSCKENPSTIVQGTPEDQTPYSRVSYTLVGYDSISISHLDGKELQSKSVIAVIVGYKDSLGFHQYASSDSKYIDSTKSYVTPFNFNVKMDPQWISSPLTIRYQLTNNQIIDIDTSVSLYKYPYTSTSIVCASRYYEGTGFGDFRDMARLGSKLYISSRTAPGLFEYDLLTSQSKFLYEYLGHFVAADSHYVFCEVNGGSIVRYNLQKGSTDLTIIPSYNYWVLGIDIYNHTLYVLLWNGNSYAYLLKTYTLNGLALDSSSVNFSSYYLAIRNGILYSTYYNQQDIRLLRYDLQSKTRLADLMFPASHEGGIKFFNDIMYFCNYDKQFLGSVPITDLISSSSMKYISNRYMPNPRIPAKTTAGR